VKHQISGFLCSYRSKTERTTWGGFWFLKKLGPRPAPHKRKRKRKNLTPLNPRMPHLLFIFAFLFFLVPQPACPLPLLFIVLEFSPLSSNWFFFPSYSWLWSSSVFPCSFFSWDNCESFNKREQKSSGFGGGRGSQHGRSHLR
jgi:hypothetical protein